MIEAMAEEIPVTLDQARAAKSKAAEMFGRRRDVVGVGITRCGASYAVKVNLSAEPATELPRSVDGVPIRVEVVGPLRKR
jgi:hypothetical protein